MKNNQPKSRSEIRCMEIFKKDCSFLNAIKEGYNIYCYSLITGVFFAVDDKSNDKRCFMFRDECLTQKDNQLKLNELTDPLGNKYNFNAVSVTASKDNPNPKNDMMIRFYDSLTEKMLSYLRAYDSLPETA